MIQLLLEEETGKELLEEAVGTKEEVEVVGEVNPNQAWSGKLSRLQATM